MSIGDSAEHDELRRVVRDFLSERSPSAEVRRLMEAGETRDDRVWALLAGQLGLTGIAVPERHGGAGRARGARIVLEEMGGALLVSCIRHRRPGYQAHLAASGDEDAMARWLPGIADGSLTATLAVAEESRIVGPDSRSPPPPSFGDDGHVTGTKLSSSTATPLTCRLSSRSAPDGPGVFAIEGKN
jgi:alkylation response protein AidB-like acyl-CoA dehydrogenase